jgi:hypothetical protein
MPALTVMIHVTQYRGHQQSVKPDEACPVQHCHRLLKLYTVSDRRVNVWGAAIEWPQLMFEP